jgi:hypothetical protein
VIAPSSFQVGIESVSDYRLDDLAFYLAPEKTSTLAKPIESELDRVTKLIPVDHHLVDLTKPSVYPEWLHPQQYQLTLHNIKVKLSALEDTDCIQAKKILNNCEQHQKYLNIFSGMLLKV